MRIEAGTLHLDHRPERRRKTNAPSNLLSAHVWPSSAASCSTGRESPATRRIAFAHSGSRVPYSAQCLPACSRCSTTSGSRPLRLQKVMVGCSAAQRTAIRRDTARARQALSTVGLAEEGAPARAPRPRTASSRQIRAGHRASSSDAVLLLDETAAGLSAERKRSRMGGAGGNA